MFSLAPLLLIAMHQTLGIGQRFELGTVLDGALALRVCPLFALRSLYDSADRRAMENRVSINVGMGG